MSKKLTLDAAAEEISASKRTVRRLISSGELRAYRIGRGIIRVDADDLEKAFKDHGITTLITVGTQVQTAVLHTAAEAALRGYKVVVPVDGMSGDSLYPEQYTAWHLANTQRVMQQVTLTKIELVGY